MGNVVSLSTYRKKIVKVKYVPTEDDEFKLLLEGLTSQWAYHHNKNNLNSFIAGKLQIEEQPFVEDLNLVAELEADTNLTVCVTAPTYIDNDGWQSNFIFDDIVYSTIELSTESRARLFGVLLFHAVMEAASNASKR
jgi:hypothetical protein